MPIRDVRIFDDGYVILGDFPSDDISSFVKTKIISGLPLVILDPDYDILLNKRNDADSCTFICRIFKTLESLCCDGASVYLFGDFGSVGFRVFYRLLVKVEQCTGWKLRDKIIWRKRQQIHSHFNYDSSYDEIAYFVLGDEFKDELPTPTVFNIPYLEKQPTRFGRRLLDKREESTKRSNVWIDISEMIKNKVTKHQKPEKLIEVFLRTSSAMGDIVFDPFSRSGVSALACRKLGRRFIVVEHDLIGFEMCVNNLSKMRERPKKPA